jgi:hypothetical protein
MDQTNPICQDFSLIDVSNTTLTKLGEITIEYSFNSNLRLLEYILDKDLGLSFTLSNN